MRSVILCAAAGVAAALGAVVACGSDPTQAAPADDAGVTPDARADAPPDGSPPPPPPPPAPSPYGLDARPANPACLAPPRPTDATGIKLVPAFAGLRFNAPVGVMQAPGDASRWYVVELGGTVRTFAAGTTDPAQVKEFFKIGPGVLQPAGEGGLLGMAFSPRWATNREVILSYTAVSATAPNNSNMRSVIARFKSTDGGVTLPFAPDELMAFDQPYTNHNGGNIAFGPDGHLYIGIGDGGSGGDPLNYGQNVNSLFGKMLRIDVNGTPAGQYRIPADNPFAGGGGKGEIFAYGLRNPWRWSFDRETGDLWVGDVGQGAWEEIDLVKKGGNYGWKVREGKHCFNATTCASAGMIDPIVEHDRSEARSITGGYVYRGKEVPSLIGKYVYGDYATGNVFVITYDANGKATGKTLLNIGQNRLASFGEGADGELYVASFAGEISKIAASSAPAPDAFPQKLSATGCVDPNDPKKPAASLIPYGVRSPLWSDAAEKERYFALPDGAKITIDADGDWDFPRGSVLVKTFALAGRRLETRLMVRHADGAWAGYTYEWDDAQTDATLLPAAKTKNVGTSDWTYPSRSQCVQCHTVASGGTLGLETGQLNSDFVYPATNRISNQLTTLAHLDIFTTPLTQPGPVYPAIPIPTASDAPLDARARSYLHSNCSHCHRPDGGGKGTMDLRFDRTFADTKTCNVTQQEGSILGAAGKIIFPGDPTKSVLSLRMHTRDAIGMPPIASHVVDAEGTKLVDAWITSLTGCPTP